MSRTVVLKQKAFYALLFVILPRVLGLQCDFVASLCFFLLCMVIVGVLLVMLSCATYFTK
jgi:hypothetical protein